MFEASISFLVFHSDVTFPLDFSLTLTSETFCQTFKTQTKPQTFCRLKQRADFFSLRQTFMAILYLALRLTTNLVYSCFCSKQDVQPKGLKGANPSSTWNFLFPSPPSSSEVLIMQQPETDRKSIQTGCDHFHFLTFADTLICLRTKVLLKSKGRIISTLRPFKYLIQHLKGQRSA